LGLTRLVCLLVEALRRLTVENKTRPFANEFGNVFGSPGENKRRMPAKRMQAPRALQRAKPKKGLAANDNAVYASQVLQTKMVQPVGLVA
jgi:hypothetical protein